MEKLTDLKNIYPVSKTLAFQLIPEGKTLEKIKENNEIGKAKELENNYINLKKAADKVHSRFIEAAMSHFRLKYQSDGNGDSLQEWVAAYRESKKDKDRKKTLQDVEARLKKQIGDAFNAINYGDKRYVDAISSRPLLTEILPMETLEKDQHDALVALIGNAGYMKKYFEARKRIYDAKQKGFTIPNRIIGDNLPIHLRNVDVFRELPSDIIDGTGDIIAETGALPGGAETVGDVMTLSFFSLLCPQSAITVYNTIIGGIAKSDGDKIKGLNELINEYNQKHSEEKGFRKVRSFKKLKKQILSDTVSLSFVPFSLSGDKELLEALTNVEESLSNTLEGLCGEMRDVINAATPSGILVERKRLDNFSHGAFGDWKIVERAIYARLRRDNPISKRQGERGYAKKIKTLFNKITRVSVQEIIDDLAATGNGSAPLALELYMTKAVEALDDIYGGKNAIEAYRSASESGNDKAMTEAKRKVRVWLDAINTFRRTVTLFDNPEDESMSTDPVFYQDIVIPWKDFSKGFTRAYNSIRNYLTKKPFSTDKTRVYFDCQELLGGWTTSVEQKNKGFLLKKGEAVYLGILPAKKKNPFKSKEMDDPDSPLRKMERNKIPGASQALPKVFQDKDGGGNTALYNTPKEISDIYFRYKSSGTPVSNYTTDEVHKMVGFYQHCLRTNPKWSPMNILTRPAAEYGTMKEFFNDVDEQAEMTTFRGVSEEMVSRAVDNGDLYLFRVMNQDMSKGHHGKDGNFKVALLEAMSDRNVTEGGIKILGGGAVYYRGASIPRKVTHPAGIPILNKNPRSWRRARTFKYDIIKDRRYTEDRFMLHLPVKMNANADANGGATLNDMVARIIKANPDMPVIGVNRGERNLITVAVTAPDGRIIEQESLNIMDNFDYREELAAREKKRTDDRQNWGAIRDIRNLKKGYLSRAVGEVARLVKKHNAIVAIENLDSEFKSSRQMFERNVYEQFESDLVRRLGHLMDKNDGDRTRNAVQLCQVMSKKSQSREMQNGAVFLINPSWITMTDPVTGFANRVYTRFESVNKCEELIGKFESVRFNPETGRFEFSFRYGEVSPAADAGDPDRLWKVETYGDRIEQVYDPAKGLWHDEWHDPTGEFRELLDDNGVLYKDGGDLRERLQSRLPDKFWEKFLKLLRVSMSNTSYDSETKEYRVIGCVADENGRFYDSRTAPAWLPDNGDTNAARNIARKAHMILRNIREYDLDNPPVNENGKILRIDKVVSDQEWFTEVQK